MSLLGLPAEVRLMIYHQLFADVTVTIRRARQEPTEGPWNILRTCQLCYREGLPVFYDCVTFKLQHELFLHVLSQKIGAQNLARVKSLAVGGYRDEVGTALVARLPTALQKFRIIYETGPDWEKDTPEGQLEDRHLQGALKLRKHWMKSCVKQMWSQKPPVRIFVETFVGLAPKYGVCGIHVPPYSSLLLHLTSNSFPPGYT